MLGGWGSQASAKAAIEVTPDSELEVSAPEPGAKRIASASEAYREMTLLGLSRGRNAMGF